MITEFKIIQPVAYIRCSKWQCVNHYSLHASGRRANIRGTEGLCEMDNIRAAGIKTRDSIEIVKTEGSNFLSLKYLLSSRCLGVQPELHFSLNLTCDLIYNNTSFFFLYLSVDRNVLFIATTLGYKSWRQCGCWLGCSESKRMTN